VARRRFAHSGGRKRTTEWIGPADQNFVGVGSGGATLIASSSFEISSTIIRTRGAVTIRPAVTVADAAIVGAFGMGIVSAEALAAGIASIPEPFSDGDWGGWFVWRSFGYELEFEDATGVSYPSWGFEVDSKAMRKIGPSEAIVFVAESQFGAFDIAASLRLLAKLT